MRDLIQGQAKMKKKLIRFTISVFGILLSLCKHIGTTAVGHNDNEQPDAVLIYYNYNLAYADRSYYYLNSAGITNQSVVEERLLNASKRSKGFEENSIQFESSDYISKLQASKRYLDPAKMTSLHVYDDPNDIKLAAGPQVDQQLCELQLNYMLHMINKHNHHITNSTDWSIFNMINSFGSPTFGLASGNTMFLGDYKACTSYKLSITKNELAEVDKSQAEHFFIDNPRQTSDSQIGKLLKFAKKYIGPFVGITETVYDSYDVVEEYRDQIRLQPTVYCVAGIRWPSWPNSTYHKRNVVFRVGVCLPNTCDSSSLDLYSDKIKRLMDIQIPDYYSGYYINNLYCLPDENSPLRDPMRYNSTVLFIAFNAIWMVLIAGATLAVYLKSRSAKNSRLMSGKELDTTDQDQESSWFTYLKCWCMISNFDAFISGEKKLEIDCEVDGSTEKTKRNAVDLSSLDGLKVVGLFAVVTAHSLILGFFRGWNFLEFGNYMSTSAISGIMPLTAACVNFFFVITGVLTSIRLLQMPKQTLTTPVFWLQFVVYRYLRIVPLYLFVHWAIQSCGRFLSLGPLWDYGTSDPGFLRRCQSESIWEVVFLMANFKSPLDHCNPVGWYLASDIQFSIITPLFIILFLKKPLVGHLTVLLTSLAVVVNHISYYNNMLPETEGYLNFPMILTYVSCEGALGYVQPQYRCLSYFIGLSAGHILLQYGRGKIKRWPSWFVSFSKLYMCSVVYIICFAGSARFLLQHRNQPLLHFLGAIYGGSLNMLSSTAMAMLIILLCTGSFVSMSNLLSKSCLKVLSASVLSPVLIHAPIIIVMELSPQDLSRVSMYTIAVGTMIAMLVSLFLGSIVHILYELPMKRFLIKAIIIILGGRKSSSQKRSTVETALDQKTSNPVR